MAMGTERESRVLAEQFVAGLAAYEGNELVFNPWRDYDARYDLPGAPAIRRQQLVDYLVPRLGRCPYVVVAEAVGYQGGRFTGIAITCERMLLGLHRRIPATDVLQGTGARTSNPDSPYITKATQRTSGFNEPTDTVVWEAIRANGLDPYTVLLWNIFPFHPHKKGEALSNRTPTPAELQSGWTFTEQLLALNGAAQVLAVGRKAADTLAAFNVSATALRHPANGGANQYRQEFADAVNADAENTEAVNADAVNGNILC